MGDKELAEFIGILLGDGNIGIYRSRVKEKSRTQYRIKITLNSEKDEDYVFYIVKLINSIFNRSPRIWKRPDSNAVDIFVFGKQSLLYLISLGMVLAPKWERAVIPAFFMNHPYDKLVLRGYMDTDGCICVVNNNGIRYPRIEMKVSPAPMQNQLIQILLQNNFNPQISKLEKGKIRITLAGYKNLNEWNQKIGFSNKRNRVVCKSFLRNSSKLF
jgi:hypothetical protein